MVNFYTHTTRFFQNFLKITLGILPKHTLLKKKQRTYRDNVSSIRIALYAHLIYRLSHPIVHMNTLRGKYFS